MSDLFRLRPVPDPSGQLADMLEELIDNGALVVTDPNYEAAVEAYANEWAEWWDEGRGLESADPHEATTRIIRAVVAAALTGDTE